MKIISYNVNGIRAAFSKGFLSWLESSQADIVCIQESKAHREQIDQESLKKIGYHNFWHSAQKKGYSGVGIISKQNPQHVEYGCGMKHIDLEGRIIRVDFPSFSVMSVYIPSASNLSRLDFKMQFCYDFFDYIKKLKKSIPNLIICGDFNICHQAIDIHDPIRLANVSGFLPMEREWLSKFIEEAAFIDSFRYINQNPNQYSWWSYRANSRARNKGWRIDYNMLSSSLENKLKKANILSDVFHSDHCPIMLEIDLDQ